MQLLQEENFRLQRELQLTREKLKQSEEKLQDALKSRSTGFKTNAPPSILESATDLVSVRLIKNEIVQGKASLSNFDGIEFGQLVHRIRFQCFLSFMLIQFTFILSGYS